MRLIFAILFQFSVLYVFAIDFVQIGHPGNSANSHGYGAVDYVYDIGKYEITNKQYCDFLNCTASRTDSCHLYSPLMQQHFMGGINRIPDVDGYRYVCKDGYENRPVVCMTWMNAVRFVNWLHYNSRNIENGIPLSEWFPYTEGDQKNGAYDTRSVPQTRNKGAIYWLPNRSEWEKSAYYDGQQWLENLIPDGSNCFSSVTGWAETYPHIAPVGLSEGPNGTFDQIGNAAEWIENSQGKWKLSLGGSLIRSSSFARCGEIEGDEPNKAISTFGFRVCRIADVESRLVMTECNLNKNVTYDVPEILTDALGTVYVSIGDINNPGDPVNRFKGTVPYVYCIARTELSNYEYCAFLNAVAVKSDPFSLYDENMGRSVCGGILRVASDDGFHYSCREGWENRPVVYIAYYDLARYANWMHYGCPSTGVSELGTTEGNSILGAYDTSDFEDVRKGIKPPYKNFGKRNRGGRFWIPDEDEWFKAAYYDPELIGSRKYHDYPTRTSDLPARWQANYMIDNELSVGEPFFVAEVDSYADAASYYGTLQQGGNVWEWIESWQYDVTGIRGLRGGSWSYTAYGLNACNTDPGGINDKSYVFGGRLCMSVDEEGWKPVKKSCSQSLYEFVLLLPKSRVILLLFVNAVFFILFIGLVIYMCMNKISKRTYGI